MYTTIENVRQFSGFDDATKITGATIRNKISMADAKLDASIVYRYALPIPYHRQNTITFSGTGNDTGTMAIVINGVTYNVAITVGLTAMQAANLFRNAAIASTHFNVDVISTESSDVIVTIISKTDSSVLLTADAEVTISASPTTKGVSGAIGTRADRFPPFITQLSTEIATALLYMDNYGIEAEDTPKDGVARMERLDKMLAQLQGTSGDGITLRIVDEITKTELAQSSSGLASGFPTDATSAEDYDGDDATQSQSKMNDKY